MDLLDVILLYRKVTCPTLDFFNEHLKICSILTSINWVIFFSNIFGCVPEVIISYLQFHAILVWPFPEPAALVLIVLCTVTDHSHILATVSLLGHLTSSQCSPFILMHSFCNPTMWEKSINWSKKGISDEIMTNTCCISFLQALLTQVPGASKRFLQYSKQYAC